MTDLYLYIYVTVVLLELLVGLLIVEVDGVPNALTGSQKLIPHMDLP